MDYESIEREIHVEATPEVVYEVISTPEHIKGWWSDEAELEPVAGAAGVISFGDRTSPNAKVVPLTVMEADPPRRFSFRWADGDARPTAPGDSLLVTFDLIPSGNGTLLRFSETGFREMGWDEVGVESNYRDHTSGWDRFLPRLADYATGQVPAL